MMLSDDQLERYARHIVLKEIGGDGQRKLLESTVAVVGAGGIGRIDAQRIGEVNKRRAALTEFPVGPRVMNVPVELFRDDVDNDRVFFIGKAHLQTAPRRDHVQRHHGKLKEQHGGVGGE